MQTVALQLRKHAEHRYSASLTLLSVQQRSTQLESGQDLSLANVYCTWFNLMLDIYCSVLLTAGHVMAVCRQLT